MLWSLKPIEVTAVQWNPWKAAGKSHCTFGFIVRADTEQEARKIAFYSREPMTKVADVSIGALKDAKVSWYETAKMSCERVDVDNEKKVTLSKAIK